MRDALQRLADLAAEAGGEPRRTVPNVGVGALADQLAVLAGEASSAGVPDDALRPLLSELSHALGVR